MQEIELENSKTVKRHKLSIKRMLLPFRIFICDLNLGDKIANVGWLKYKISVYGGYLLPLYERKRKIDKEIKSLNIKKEWGKITSEEQNKLIDKTKENEIIIHKIASIRKIIKKDGRKYTIWLQQKEDLENKLTKLKLQKG